MSTMPITPKDVGNFPYSFSSPPIIQETSTTYPCTLFLYNQTAKQIFVNIQEKRLSSKENPKIKETPISNQGISLKPLEIKTVTVFFQSVEIIPPNSNLPSLFQFPLERELHIQSTSKGYMDCISACSISLQRSKFSFNLLQRSLPNTPSDNFISVESRKEAPILSIFKNKVS